MLYAFNRYFFQGGGEGRAQKRLNSFFNHKSPCFGEKKKRNYIKTINEMKKVHIIFITDILQYRYEIIQKKKIK